MTAARRLPIEALQPYLLDVPHPGFLPPDSPLLVPAPPVSLPGLFGNDHPIEIEVGFGKGLFLLQQGQARPSVNFLGIEIERKYTLHTAARVARSNLGNVKLACTDARWFLRERLAERSISALHIYFPDPWWKNRHKKRKVFTDDFIAQVLRVLTDQGRLYFATDVADYFTESLAIVQARPELLPLPDSAWADLNGGEFLTNFERKYRQEGRPIHRAVWKRGTSTQY